MPRFINTWLTGHVLAFDKLPHIFIYLPIGQTAYQLLESSKTTA